MVASKKRLKELNDKAAETAPERKVHCDFTIDEFDTFTAELQNSAASSERVIIMEELERVAAQMKHLALMMTNDDASTFETYAAGITMAINIISEMRSPEENVGCKECGAI